MTDQPTTTETTTEPAGTSAPAPAPKAAGPSGGLSSRARWGIAGGVVAVSVAILAGAVLLLGGRPVPEALTYIPADSAIVAELRLDLPGDQLQKVGNLLAHFPGFKDQSSLPQKLDEALGRLTSSATNGSVDYAKQVKPWIAGPTFAAGSAAAMSAAAPATPGPAASGDAPTTDRDLGLIVATTDGTAKCESLFATGESVTVLTDQPGSIYASADGTKACSIQGRIGILGSRDLVKAAIAAHAGHNGVDATTAYRTARDTLGGDRLATVYVSKAGLAASLRVGGGAGALASAMPLASGGLGAALAAIPEWTMGGVSAEDDALVADLVSAPVTAPSASADGGSPLPSLPPAHASRTATLVPADTLALVDVHGAGIALRTGIARLRADPTLGAALGQVDTTLAALGGADQLVAWVEDAGIAVVPDGPGATGGVLLLATDDASATTKVAQVKSLLSLAGLGGTQIQVHDETVAGTTMTVVDLGDLGSLLQGLGAGSAVPLPAGQHVTVAFAAKGPAVIAGGDAFVRATLGLAAGGSLADAAPYRHAIGRAAAENLGEVYVGTSSLLALADTLLPEAQRASFDTDTKPYLEPFDAILVTTTLERGGAHVRLVATVK